MPTLSDLQQLRSEKSGPTLADLQKLREIPTEKLTFGRALKEDLGNIGSGMIDLMTPPKPGDIEGSSQKGLNAALAITPMGIAGKGIGAAIPRVAPLAERGLAKTGKVADKLSSSANKKGFDAVKNSTAIDAPRMNLLKAGHYARSYDQLEKVANGMRGEATTTLKQAIGMGAQLRPEASFKIMSNIDSKLKSTGISDEKLHGDTLSAIRNLKAESEKGPMSLERLEQHRQILRQVIKKNTSKMEGPGVEVPKAMSAIEAIDDALDKMSPKDFAISQGYSKPRVLTDPSAVKLIEQYRDQYARARRFEALSDKIIAAHGDASKIEDTLQKMVDKKGGLNGFKPEERAAIRKLANRGLKNKALKGVGTFGLNPAKKNFNAFIPGVELLAGAAHMPYAAPLGIAGTAANLYRNMLTKGQAEKILNLIQKGQP